MHVIVSLLALVLLLAPPARADTLSPQDKAAFAEVITGQIEAFRADDGPRAYAFAAPSIKRIFPDPELFMKMVRNGYMPVYRPQSFRFGDATFGASGRPTQRVSLVGPDGLSYEAIYTMERQPDGTWLINGDAGLAARRHPTMAGGGLARNDAASSCCHSGEGRNPAHVSHSERPTLDRGLRRGDGKKASKSEFAEHHSALRARRAEGGLP
ncbi:DUF4864 domain-containing protein [Aestuariivirga sp.]|uniref:DUF4864 domain-containing protein n=1 Tax=Aestuariivirga sp. TaxID=2650926 RepID=UPI003919F2A9